MKPLRLPWRDGWLGNAATYIALVSGLSLGAALFNDALWSRIYSRDPVSRYRVELVDEHVPLGGQLEVLVEVDKNRDCPVEIVELVRRSGDTLAPWQQVGHYRAPLFEIGDNEPKIFAVSLPARLFPPGLYVYDRFSHYLCVTGGSRGTFAYASGPLEFEIVSPAVPPLP